ncbi:MAG: CsbD family protein [Shimia sp.]
MDDDRIKGKTTEIEGKLRSKYGDMTDDEVQQAKGDRQQAEGILQQKYGKTKDEAREAADEIFGKS